MATVKSEIEELKSQIEQISNRVNSMAHDTPEEVVAQLREQIKHVRSQMQDYRTKASDALKEGWEQTSQTAKETGKKIQQYTEENPWKVVAIAALVGFVIGMLSNRDRD